MELKNKTIIVGITGGIAAYWAVEIVGAIINRYARVHVIMTDNATKFISPLTFQAVSQNKVLTNLFELDNKSEICHISYAKKADLIIVAPATANFIGKIANGIVDDMLLATITATKAPVIICPAMNNQMWENSIVQENVKKLEKHGYYFVNPEYGKMACGGKGIGRLASIDSIVNKLKEIKVK